MSKNDPPAEPTRHEDDKLLCYCKNIRYGEVRTCVAEGAKTVEQVMKRSTAGTGCRSCHFDIEEVLKEDRAVPKKLSFWRRLFGPPAP
jgi:NAD(P)H-nitrite reductase large subunit